MNIFTIDFWFTSGAIASTYAWALLLIFVVMIGVGILLNYRANMKGTNDDAFTKRLYKRLFDVLATMGSLGILLTFFYYEGAYIISWKFWLGVWFIVTLWWLFPVLKYYKSIASRREERKKAQKFKKYL